MIENSEVMRTVLTTLFKISNRKDTDINVISTMGSLVKKLDVETKDMCHPFVIWVISKNPETTR